MSLWAVNHWGNRWSIAEQEAGWFDCPIGKVKSCKAIPLEELKGTLCYRTYKHEDQEKTYAGHITEVGLKKSTTVGVFWLQGQKDIPFYFWQDINNLTYERV